MWTFCIPAGEYLELRPLPPAKSSKLLPLLLLGDGNLALPDEFTADDAFLRLVPRANAHSTRYPG
jgi:hypothetical protein